MRLHVSGILRQEDSTSFKPGQSTCKLQTLLGYSESLVSEDEEDGEGREGGEKG